MDGDARVGAWIAAGLYDPDAEGARPRRALLAHLTEIGATIDDMVGYDRAGRLPALAGTLVRRGSGPWVTPAELEADGVVDHETFTRVWQSAGFPALAPDERGLNTRDANALRAFIAGTEMFGEESLLQFTRTVGAALASIADAAVAIFGLNVGGALLQGGADEMEYAQAIEDASRVLVFVVPEVIEALFVHHVDGAVARYVAGGGDEVGAAIAYLAVGFVDLVESTALVQSLGPADAATALSRFEREATEIVAARGGRLVKTIGDEVMFVGVDAASACEIALELADLASADRSLAGLRGGVAWGPLARGYGDFYGPVVNLAARAVKAAAPGQVLVDAETAAHARDAARLRFAPAGDFVLRGFPERVALFAVTRAES